MRYDACQAPHQANHQQGQVILDAGPDPVNLPRSAQSVLRWRRPHNSRLETRSDGAYAKKRTAISDIGRLLEALRSVSRLPACGTRRETLVVAELPRLVRAGRLRQAWQPRRFSNALPGA